MECHRVGEGIKDGQTKQRDEPVHLSDAYVRLSGFVVFDMSMLLLYLSGFSKPTSCTDRNSQDKWVYAKYQLYENSEQSQWRLNSLFASNLQR